MPHQLVTVASLFCDISDIYGVGRTGILCNFMAGSANWTYLGSSGTGFTTTNFTTPFTVGASSGPFDQMTLSSGCVISDLNGDGIKDAACVQPAGSGTSGTGNWNMALSSARIRVIAPLPLPANPLLPPCHVPSPLRGLPRHLPRPSASGTGSRHAQPVAARSGPYHSQFRLPKTSV